MRYVFSGLVGFVVTLVISLPVQHLMQIKEARASSLGSLKFKARAIGRAMPELLVDVPPLAGGMDPKEPRIKFLPQYPAEAAEMQLEGFVVLSFNVAPDGSVQNLKVVESEPPMVFDKAAKRAVSRWNFKPVANTGKVAAASLENEQKLRLNFNLKKALASEDSTSPSL